MRAKAFLLGSLAGFLTAAYPVIAGWKPGFPAMVAAGVLVGSWMMFLHYSPVLIGWVGELLAPLAVCVASAFGRLAFFVGRWVVWIGLVLFGVAKRADWWVRFGHGVGEEFKAGGCDEKRA